MVGIWATGTLLSHSLVVIDEEIKKASILLKEKINLESPAKWEENQCHKYERPSIHQLRSWYSKMGNGMMLLEDFS